MKSIIAAALFSAALAGPALAFQCPADIAAINAALESANLSEEQRTQVAELRDEGERLHQSGQHQASVDTLAQAKEILGIN